MYIHQSQVIIAQAFGQARYGPGLSNEALARIVQAHYERYGLPIIAQIEVAEALIVLGVPIYAVIRVHRQLGKYLDTVEVLRQAKVACDLNGWKIATLVSHPHHSGRVQAIAQRLGFEYTFIAVSELVYDPASTQWWTRGPLRFKLHERLAWPVSMWATRM